MDVSALLEETDKAALLMFSALFDMLPQSCLCDWQFLAIEYKFFPFLFFA